MGRARSRNPKSYQHCLRLTKKQEELLQRYTDFREFNTDMDAIRAMIDGLEDWFRRQEAKQASLQATHRTTHSSIRLPEPGEDPRPEGGDGAQLRVGVTQDARISESIIDAHDVHGQTDVSASQDGDTEVGDFAGLPAVRLPESRHDGME